MYARNLSALLQHLCDAEGRLKLDWSDEITLGTCLMHDGRPASELAAAGATP
jgi:NAD/NADP transhydrogenase alpha subunit